MAAGYGEDRVDHAAKAKEQALEDDGFDYLIGNEDVAKDALAFIEMLQLRLQFQIKTKSFRWVRVDE